MLTAFWSGLGDEFAKRWAARILTPAFAFWAGGLVVLWWHAHAPGVQEHGWAHELSATTTWLRGLPGIAQAALVVVGLILLTASALIAERLTMPLLQLLEGYWPRPQWLRNKLITYRRWRRRRWDERVKELATPPALRWPEHGRVPRPSHPRSGAVRLTPPGCRNYGGGARRASAHS